MARQARQHAGRVTLGECPVRGDELPHAPINRITTWSSTGKAKHHCTCSCGRRFPASHPDAAQHLVDPLDPDPTADVEPGISETWRFDEIWPDEARAERAVQGVVPIGTEVLHRPTAPVGRITDDVRRLAVHMVDVMHRAPGVGLAANQVGAPLRVFVQVHERAAPQVVVDPVVRATEGRWHYPEGCLSVVVDRTQANVARPQRIQVHGRLITGEHVEMTLDEVVARICQHELDHLDGIEYVQRLTGSTADRIYATLAEDGIDLAWVPRRPY